MDFFGFKIMEGAAEPWLIWKCPQCDITRHFDYVVGPVHLEGPGDLGPACDFVCPQCRYHIRVSEKDRPLAEQVQQLTKRFLGGQMTAESYQTEIKKVPALFIRDLLMLTEEWKCQKCGESNPLRFEVCWNCQAK